MNTTQALTTADKALIEKYFGVSIETLTLPQFEQLRKQMRKKYHPDNFAKFEDETVQEMATERFQQIEALNEKIAAHLKQEKTPISNKSNWLHEAARFAANRLKIEIRTPDKELKYRLFGKRNYKWLLYGETFRIPNTTTSIVMDETHQGTRIGYQETIRIYLSFGEQQPTEDVADWIYNNIADSADTLIVGGQKVAITADAILQAIRQETFLGIGEGVARQKA